MAIRGRVLVAATVALMGGVLLMGCQKNGTPASTSTASVETASVDQGTPPATRTASVASVSLEDVQALFGGQNIWISSKGKVIAQVVEPGLKEKRYELALDPGQFAEVEAQLAKHQFAKIEIEDRPGVPDEARPTITVVTADGKATVVAKWANDKHAGFDSIYQQLLAIVDRAKQANKLLYEGKFDYKWRPDGWR
ncbi:MAG: hypothetical protein JRI68_06070 [Deltaproteobacteria bacterium]|nr:hypothetical protein [Deltaproteobacteria bacterium]